MSEFPIEVLLKSIAAPVLVIGSDQRVSLQNPAATALFKLDFTGRHYVMALRQPALIEAIEQAMQDGSQKTARFIARIGAMEQTYDALVVPEGGQTLIILDDQSSATEVDVLRRDFVANVSHELRTPLTALSGIIETLQGPARNDPKAIDRFLAIMASEADRLRDLVDGLLSLSRVEETERSRPVDPVDLTQVVGQVTALLAPVADKADAPLTTETPQSPVTVPGDAAQLQQILQNLIENAIKYGATPAGIAVAIGDPAYETALQQKCVRLSVRDCGLGIAAPHLARLTERFYRVDDHRDRAQGGMGLGLAIVKHIVNRHRGRIIFESVEGEGTTVTVLLPTQADDVPKQRRED